MKKSLIILTSIFALFSSAAYSQKTYNDVMAVSSQNRGVSGLRSMQDGEHYTVSRGGAILRHSYADQNICDTLYKGRFASYEFTPAEDMIILGNNYRPIYRHSSTVDYQIVSIANGKEVAKFNGIRDLSLSPDSKMYAYAKDNNLYVGALGQEATAVTNDGEWNKVINGTADWVYEEEYGFTKAYAFSTDSKKIAYLRFDESQVPTFEMMRFDGTLYNKPYTFKYPKAGDKNSVVELWLYDIASAKKELIASGEERDEYIPFIGWTPAGELYYYRIDRKQRNFEVVLCREGGEQQVIYKETSPRYVERPALSTIRFIDGDRFIAQNETLSGWNHIYLYSIKNGLQPLRALTEGEWQVTSIVETTDKHIYYMSTESSPLRRNLYSIDYKGKNKRRLTEREGTYSISPSKGMNY